MIKIVISYIHYPVAIARYFHEALLKRDDVEVLSVGPSTGNWIPWNGGMHLPVSYVRNPDLAYPMKKASYTSLEHPGIVLAQLRTKDFEPDLWINVNAGFGFSRPDLDCQVVNIFTDGHVLENHFYIDARGQADISFNMHQAFAKPGDRILPYAASEIYHFPEEVAFDEKEYDVCLIGLHYEERNRLVHSLRGMGLNVYYDIGPAYHDYREIYSKSKVAVSWSSKGDLIARVFESMAMEIPLVTDRVPDLPTHFVEDEHYKGFNSLAEAIQKVRWCVDNYDDAMEMASNAHRKVYAQHLYKYRVSNILRECKLI